MHEYKVRTIIKIVAESWDRALDITYRESPIRNMGFHETLDIKTGNRLKWVERARKWDDK